MSNEVSNTTEVIEEVVFSTTPEVVVEETVKVATEKVPFMKKHKWAVLGSAALAVTAAIMGGLAYKKETPVAKEIADDNIVQQEEQ